MSTEDPLKNWQLENSARDDEQWKLEDAEQDLSKHMQLQPGEPNAYWQPVEYEREAQSILRLAEGLLRGDFTVGFSQPQRQKCA